MTKEAINKIDDLLFNRAYDPNKEPPPNQIVFRIEQKNIGSLQNIVTITGLPKNGKGKFIAGIAAAALSRQEVFSMSIRLPEGKQGVALWDTEQSDYDFYKSMETIKKLAGIDTFPPHFHAFNVREDEPMNILKMIDRYLQLNENCGLLILDGMLDLLTSYNDEAESKRLVNILKRWSKLYNLLIPAVLHRGKSSSTTVGHLGSMADRASQSILIVEKVKERNTFQLRPDFLRSADDFTPIEIYYNNHSHQWEQTDYIPSEEDQKVKRMILSPPEINREVHSANVMRIFNSEDLQSYDLLVQNIREIYAQGREWARKCIPFLMQEGLLFKTQHGYTREKKTRLFINQ
jgi:hypothetical protein